MCALQATITAATAQDPNAVMELIRSGSEDETRETAANRQIIEANYSLMAALIRAGVRVPQLTTLSSDNMMRIAGPPQPATLGLPSVGSITFSGQPSDTDQLTISDDGGSTDQVYEFESGGGITGDVSVTIGASVLATAQNLINAINSNADTEIQAMRGPVWSGSDAVIWLVHESLGDNDDAITDAASNVTVTGLENGRDAS